MTRRRWPAAATTVVPVALVALVTLGASAAGAAPAPVRAPRTVVVHGTARLDGRKFDARWIGAIVSRHGLVTPCQATLPPVRAGRFTVPVLRRAASAGCGGAGSEVLFWTYRGDRLFADRWQPWSTTGTVRQVRFSTRLPQGAAPPVTELSGRAFDAQGRAVPLGTRVEARVASTVCGVASVRAGGGFRGYILNVVGPESIPACQSGATLTFLIGGRPATQTAVNGQSQRGLFRLTTVAPSAA